MTSATDNRTTELLHKLLDERGVKWWEGEDERKAHWVANGLTWEYFNDENGDAWLGFLGACENDVTPEQAIAATLGSGTCKITATATNNLMYPDYMTKWYELSCGHSLTLKGDEAPKWCAVCGAKVIQGVDNAD